MAYSPICISLDILRLNSNIEINQYILYPFHTTRDITRKVQGPVSRSLLKIKVTLKDFLDFLPPLKNLGFTKPPSLKESLKTPLNFKEAKDLP